MPEELGDRLAAEAQRLRLLLEHLAGRAVRARVETEDLLQEVFLRALTSPEQVPAAEAGELALRRWLNAVARHAVVDVARALRASKRDGGEVRLARSDWSVVGRGTPAVRASALAADTPGPGTRVAGAEEGRRLAAAFRRLAPDHRRVLGLRQFEGLPAADAARRMGRSETAVHSLYRRALEAWAQECDA